ncbi:hypothetical protein JJB98_06005 [Bradyrhizobium diazoefficiens]|nr:hypothetical protein [Bradyrhizobium diazoefficiens]QQO19484.1 hypothetical protein JJB98_06005 [Bradyrhizobium diazoefficiens]
MNDLHPSGMAKTSLTLEQLAQLKSEVLGHAPYAARVSLALIVRLACNSNDFLPVLRQIDALEDLKARTTVKEEQQFKYPPLFPLWHAHYFASRHTLRNIGERWNISRGEGNSALKASISAVAERHGHDPDKWPGVLLHRIFIEGMTERANANRLTGDWIIFAKHDGENYYLDLAQHEEAEGPIKSDQLMQKLRAGSAAEFPFVFPAPSRP